MVSERKIILASASPRRRELLKQMGLNFEVIPSNRPEIVDPGKSVCDTVMSLALQKATDIASQADVGSLVIGADTVVSLNGILGKPEDEKDAFVMLKNLSGKWHEVVSGLAVIDASDKKHMVWYETTRVKMRDYTDEEIQSYIKTGEPMDKAGAYGIQGLGALLVERLEGCYFNVVGLPIQKLYTMLRNFNVRIL